MFQPKYLVPTAVVVSGFLIGIAPLRSEQSATNKPVPLSQITSTSPQRGLSQILLEKSCPNWGTNISLVIASDANNAVQVTTSSENNPPSQKNNTQHWLAAYLGDGIGMPPCFVVDEVLMTTDTVRLTYHQPTRESYFAGGTLQYYYWIPLGTLAPGTYNLQLYDAKLRAVTLMRRVDIK